MQDAGPDGLDFVQFSAAIEKTLPQLLMRF
eukprot:SAG31_NODE_5312_length_2615_cov_1.416534_2_plen_30_part_00